MTFNPKNSLLSSFANISTQPTKPVSSPKISFTTPVGTPITKTATSDLYQVASLLKDSKGAVLAIDKNSAYEYNFFEVQKTYAGKLISDYDPSALSHAFPRFKPFESLTGLTTTRPEVVMAMTFKPLFIDQKREDAVAQETGQFKTFTNEGELIDAQIQLFNLKYEAFSKLIADMKQNADAQKVLVDNEDQFLAHIDKLTSQANFLGSIVLTFENLKQFLNIRSNRSKIDFSTVVYNYFRTITSDLKGQITSRFESGTNFFKILGECGFTEQNVKNFSNTKIYLQSLYELKKLLISASDEMTGIDGSQKLNDSDPTSIIKSKIMDINREISLNVQNFTNTDLRTVQGSNFKGVASKVSAAFRYFDTIQAATPDDRIALLYHLVSKEYSYSYAFADASFVRFTEQTFGYKVADANNLQMFDTFIGHPGNRIVDAVYSLSPNAAMATAQQNKGDFLVLPFESDYIDYDASIFSPGTSYYIDESLKVSQTGLDLNRTNELRILAENQTKFQSTLYKYLIPKLQNTFNNDTAYGEKISNSTSLFNMCMSTFVDPTTKSLKTPFSKSNLGIVFDKANSDLYLKSLLFMYFHVCTLGVANDDAFQLSSRGMVEDISKEIAKRLQGSTQSSSKIALTAILNPGGSVSSKVATSIETELKDRSEFTNLFAAQLSAIYNTFIQSKCLNGDVTRYSGTRNSVLFMMIFEMLFATFSRLNEKKAVSFTTALLAPSVVDGSRSSNIFQMKSITSYGSARLSFSQTVTSKLQFENDLVLKIMMTHLSMFDSLQNAIRNSISSLQKPENVKALNDVLKIVQSNENLSLLMNHPQISLVRNAVDDINSKFSARLRQNYKKDTDRIDVAATYLKDQKNDLVLFDDFLVPGAIKQTLYEYFSNEKFSVNRAFNSRILSVGIPQGFASFLKEKVALSNISQQTLGDKESDVIKVNVYKVDVRYQNIVFKPQSFMFEMSRFVSKDYSSYLPVKEGSSEKQIAESIPMRDYSIITDVSQMQANTFGKNSALYQSSEYDFLTVEQKDDLMVNHIRSHMLELYVKLLSGFSVSEIDFLIDESTNSVSSMSPIVVNKLIDESVKKISKAPPVGPVSNKITSIATVQVQQPLSAKNTVNPVSKVLTFEFSPKITQNYESQNKVIIDSAKTRTLYSDSMSESRRIMKPKVFDRIFNVFVDPDDFEIDQIETNKTDSGKDMLESLFSAGKVIELQTQTSLRSTDITQMSRLKLIDKNPKENDALFEKYFITLETVLGEVV